MLTLSKIIGRGSFAVVKLGYDLETNKPVAIRIIDKEKLSPTGLQFLRKECEIYPTVDHPSIVKCHLCKEVLVLNLISVCIRSVRCLRSISQALSAFFFHS